MGIFKKSEPGLDVRLDRLLAVTVNAFHEDRRDLELVRETVELIAHGTEAQRRSATFVLLYACALLSDAVSLEHPEMDEAAFIEEIFKNAVELFSG